ncbi:DUF7824 domain-containing protein [Brachybacterium sp. DNPG3]
MTEPVPVDAPLPPLDPAQTTAITVFHELGWADARLEQVLELPLGTPEQRRTAVAGLSRGDWTERAALGERMYGLRSTVPVDRHLLGVFAIRAGVGARRAAEVMPSVRILPDSVQAAIVVERGEAFARGFIAAACTSTRRPWVHASSVHAGAAVRALHALDLEVPESIEYLKDWAAFAAAALGRPAEVFPERERIDAEVLRPRFVEHLRTGAELAMPATASFGEAAAGGIEAGWIAREEALPIVVAALDTAQRPGDRKVWWGILAGPLAATDEELGELADALAGPLAALDPFLVEGLVPRLVPGADADRLMEFTTISLLVKGKKARLAVLRALAAREIPAEAAAVVAEAVAPLAADRDRQLSRIAQTILDGLAAEAEEATSVLAAPAAPAAPAAVRGAWEPTPEVWEVPRFVPGEADVESVAQSAAVLMATPESVVSIESERFLALLVALAHRDLDLARTAVRGVHQRWVGGLRCAEGWDEGNLPTILPPPVRPDDVLWMREIALLARIGELPLLLSTPSREDMSIDVEDLLARLAVYRDAGLAVDDPDLQLALARLDLARPDRDDPDLGDPAASADRLAQRIAAFEALEVPTLLHHLKEVVRGPSAGAIAAAYLREPLREPATGRGEDGLPRAEDLVPSPAFAELPARFGCAAYERWYRPTVHPTWDDAVSAGLSNYPDAERGEVLRAAARRARPLGPVGAALLLGSLRHLHPRAAEDAMLGAIEAHRRGLLRPGVADAAALGDQDLAAFARIALELADDGLAPVLWPLLDGLLVRSLAGTRLLAGTADVAEAMLELAPAAALAAADDGAGTGLRPAEILAVPGLRALAARRGSSRAVTVAREAVALLPEPPSADGASGADASGAGAPTPADADAAASAPEPPMLGGLGYEEIWPEGTGGDEAVEDAAVLTAQWAEPDAPTKMLTVDIRLPQHPGRVFRVLHGWGYDLEHRGQCHAFERGEEEKAPVAYGRGAGESRGVSLAWDGERLERFARAAEDGPLTTSMHAVVLAMLCHDGADGIGTEHLVGSLLAKGLLSWRGMAVGVRALLSSALPPAGDASPARMVRIIEKNPRTLPVMWPVLTESIAAASAVDGTLPRWLSRVLDVATIAAPILKEAARRGEIPAEAAGFRFPGLDALASRPGKQAALVKARALAARAARA